MDKSVLALQKTLGKLVADAVGFLRRNFTRLEGLPHLIGDDITFLTAPDGLLVLPLVFLAISLVDTIPRIAFCTHSRIS